MDYEKLVKLLEPLCSEKAILKVFVFGSRVWGTASVDADWDFFVVIENYAGCVHPTLGQSLVGCQVDISAYSVEQWKSLLFEHDMLALVCEYLPSQFRWKDAYDSEVQIVLKTLVRGISKEVQKCLSMSFVHWKNGDRRTSVKNFVHATRYLGFATQLSSNGKIDDLGVANDRLKSAMERLKDETATYETYSLFYKPQILTMLTQFQDTVQHMILEEIELTRTLQTTLEDPNLTIIKYLNARGLSNLRRFFCITIALQSQSKHFKRYLLSATVDSPPAHPFSIACGCTLVELHLEDQKWRLLACPRSFVETRTLDSLSIVPSDLMDHQPPYWGTRWHAHDCEIVQYYNQMVGTWELFCASSRADSASIEEAFRSKFVALGMDYPQDKRLCATWLYNLENGHIRPIGLGGVEEEIILEIVSRGPLGMWPKFDLEAFETLEDIKRCMGEMETEPLTWAGLYFPKAGRGWRIESRSRIAYASVVSTPDDDTENNAGNQLSRHYCVLAVSLRQNASILREMSSTASTAIESELELYHSVVKSVTFFWSLVKPHAGDAMVFTKRMTALKFWNPVISVMQAIRQHPSQDPIIILCTSPIKTYQHWKGVFNRSKIPKLVELVSNLISQPPNASSSSQNSAIQEKPL